MASTIKARILATLLHHSPTNYPSNARYGSSSTQDNSSSGSGPVLVAMRTTAQIYQYNSYYQSPPEKITEAQKAARVAVGALALNDVFVAVDKKSLELLTNPLSKSLNL